MVNKIYSKIWQLAKPYYKKGHPMDIEHIEWIMKDVAFVCEQENLDNSLLLPLVILHDVGYAEVPKDNPFKLNLREAHMKAGAISIMRTYSSTGQMKRPFYNADDPFCENREPNASRFALDLFYERLLKVAEKMHTKMAKKIAKRRTDFLIDFLREFKLELEGK